MRRRCGRDTVILVVTSAVDTYRSVFVRHIVASTVPAPWGCCTDRGYYATDRNRTETSSLAGRGTANYCNSHEPAGSSVLLPEAMLVFVACLHYALEIYQAYCLFVYTLLCLAVL